MKEAVEAIAGKLVDAAYERFGRPPEPGGIYIEEVIKKHDVPAYFRELVRLSREPRSQELWECYQAFCDDDAAMVTEAGIAELDGSNLPRQQRTVIKEIRAFEAWVNKTEAAWIEQINRDSMR